MNIEKQVPNLELCKRLKELGYPQEGLFWWLFDEWLFDKSQNKYKVIFKTSANENEFYDDKGLKETAYVAPTVAEIGEVMPAFTLTYRTDYEPDGEKTWIPKFTNGTHIENMQFGQANTEADARAKLLIYLYENKLMGEGKWR